MRVITIVEYDQTVIKNLSSMLGSHLLFTLLSQELPLELQLCNKETLIQTIVYYYATLKCLPHLPFGCCIKDLVDLSFLLHVSLQSTRGALQITGYNFI